MPLHTYNPLANVPTKGQPSTPYGIQELGQDFKTQGHYDKIQCQIKVTL